MKTYLNRIVTFNLFICSILLNACVISESREDSHALLRANMPRSILLLPPINESADVVASYSWLTSASKPIAENGFYVFPVAVVDAFMKDNGLSNPEDIHAVPIRRLGRVFGADAIMYATVENFGEEFSVFDSMATINVRAQLVDVRTQRVIWSGQVNHTEHNTKGAGVNLLGAVASSVVPQAGGNPNDGSHHAAIVANRQLFSNSFAGGGLLWGPAHPSYTDQMQGISTTERAVGPLSVE